MKKYLCMILFCCIFISGCTSNAQSTNTESSENIKNHVTFTDARNHTVTIDNPKHVTVLSGSLADAWLLAGGNLFAVTKDAFTDPDYDLPSTVQSVGNISAPDVESIISSDTDFVILSANISGQVSLQAKLEKAGITTACFNIETFDDYASMMKIFTAITNRPDLYQNNVLNIKSSINKQTSRKINNHPSILLLRSSSSGVTVKNSKSMTGQMLKDLGCINVADSNSVLSENISMEAIIQANPDYIFVTTMGDSKEAALKSVDQLLTSNPAWNSLSAVQNKHYYVLDKNLFQNKPNERWAESYKILADILYGD